MIYTLIALKNGHFHFVYFKQAVNIYLFAIWNEKKTDSLFRPFFWRIFYRLLFGSFGSIVAICNNIFHDFSSMCTHIPISVRFCDIFSSIKCSVREFTLIVICMRFVLLSIHNINVFFMN